MKPNEFRINNYITIDNGERPPYKYQLTGFDIYKLDEGCDDDGNCDKKIVPIPLTLDELTKAGFTYNKARGACGADMWAGMGFILKDGECLFRGTPNDLTLVGFFNTRIQYVHELQNIYYDLKKVELKF